MDERTTAVQTPSTPVVVKYRAVCAQAQTLQKSVGQPADGRSTSVTDACEESVEIPCPLPGGKPHWANCLWMANTSFLATWSRVMGARWSMPPCSQCQLTSCRCLVKTLALWLECV